MKSKTESIFVSLSCLLFPHKWYTYNYEITW